ncbi:MAG TPA: FGGY family carbohydrate kinase, partial [Acidimicrobiales bacterium]|nr:FGGY family carbohydrate kinase [Acidimicrobiales bacterium]
MPGTSQSSQLSELTAGVDIGTTSVKAVLADEDGDVVARFRDPSALVVRPAGRFEHDAVQTWWQGPRVALQALTASHAPHAVAVSAMMPSVAA